MSGWRSLPGSREDLIPSDNAILESISGVHQKITICSQSYIVMMNVGWLVRNIILLTPYHLFVSNNISSFLPVPG